MNKIGIYFLLAVFTLLISCDKNETASEIIHKTISAIDTIESIYYKQDMERTNPQDISDTIYRFREMYFKRLISDSIVGVKGHWYMYVNDKENVIYEDIYDGNKLIRKNNSDSVATIYDLEKFPAFRNYHFWSHNTLYGMQYEFKYILENLDTYSIERIDDTIVDGISCYQILIKLENKMSMPGFFTELENNQGNISETLYCIDKETYYPLRVKGESYMIDNPEQKTFMDQKYYDIKFNLAIDEENEFKTSEESFTGYEPREMEPE